MNYQEIFDKTIYKKNLTDAEIEDLGTVAICAESNAPKHLREYIENKPELNSRLMAVYKKMLLADAPNDFECFCRYVEFDRPKAFYFPRRHYLEPVVKELQYLNDGDLDVLIIRLPSRVGKLVADDTCVLTRDGWKTHGELTTDDYVIGADGHYKKVLYVHPKGFANRKVTFANGEEIICHENHEWVVHVKATRKYLNPIRIFETKKIESMKYMSCGVSQILIEPHNPIIGEYKELPVHPYVLGAWLGDGRTTSPRITTPDIEIINAFEDIGYKATSIIEQVNNLSKHYEFGWSLRPDLQKLGMCRTYRQGKVEKFIPEIYLRASIEQRKQLLAGLIDTDGDLSRKERRYHFSTTNLNLRDSVIELLHSFGIRTSCKSEEPKLSSSGIQGKLVTYQIGFQPFFEIPCRVPRKQLKVFNKKKPRRIGIVNIEKTEQVQGNCITVDGGIYCVGKTLIPTHNSSLVSGLFCLWRAGKYPKSSILAGTANDNLSSMLYNKFLAFYRENEKEFLEVFPKAVLKKKSLENYGIWLQSDSQEYPSYKSMSVETGREGSSEYSNLAILDDTQQSQDSQAVVDRNWEKGVVPQILNRKTGRSPILAVGTARGLFDHQSRLIQWAEDHGYKYKILAIPMLDNNDKSNFECTIWGLDGREKIQFSTEDMIGERKSRQHSPVLRAQWAAEYQCNPIPVEGFMFPELLRGDPPDRAPDVAIARADTAADGTDSTNMQICRGYLENGRIKGYITKIMHDDSGSKITVPKMVKMIIENNIKEITIESNTGGAVFADAVEYMLNQQGYLCKINKKHQNSNKHGRISGASGFILENIYFKKSDDYTLSSDYGKAVTEIMSYTATGLGVKHDDAPDVTAAIAEDLMLWLMKAAKKTETRVSKRWF